MEQVRTPREIWTVMGGLMTAMLLAMLDNTIVGTAMPTIVGELGGLTHQAWVVTAYALATAVATPVWAKLGDLYGRKGVFMAAIALFLAGSALSGLSTGMVELIAFRAVQGLGAGGLMVGAMAIIGDLVPPRERARYQGAMAAVMPLAFIGGPLLGGFLTDNLSWRWAFYVNLPLGAFALAVIGLTMHLPRVRREARVDWRGAGLLTVAIGSLTLLTSLGGSTFAWVSWPGAVLAALTAAATLGFLRVESGLERAGGEPILALRLFRDRTFAAATALTFLVGFAMFGAVTFLPQFQQNVQGASATSSGLLLLPMLAGMLVTSLAGGQLVSRTGRYRTQMIVGAAVMAAGLFLLATMGTTTSTTVSGAYMAVLGIGMGMLMQTTNLVMQNAVDRRDIGAASGASTLFRTVGGSIGVSLLGVLYARGLTGSLTAQLGAAQAGHVAGGTTTPALLSSLPASVRTAYEAAVTSGVTSAFLWAGVAATLAVGAAWLVRETPLRATPAPAERVPEPAAA